MSSKQERCRTRDTWKEEGKIGEEILAHGLFDQSENPVHTLFPIFLNLYLEIWIPDSEKRVGCFERFTL